MDRVVTVGNDLKLPAPVIVPAARIEAAAPIESMLEAVDATGARDAIGALSKDNMLSIIKDQAGIIYLDSYPRQSGETDDSPRLGRALAAAASLGATVLQLGAKTYTLATQVGVAVTDLTIRGAGQQATTLTVPNDVVALNITGSYVRIEYLRVNCTSMGRTVYPVKFDNANHGVISGCYFKGMDGSKRAGVHLVGGSMGRVHNSTFSHACIRVETWDVRIVECFIWAMSCEFGIGIFSGVGNTRVEGVDLVPPFASNPDGLAAIYVSGASFNTRLASIYLDGNPALNVREGIIIRNGAGGTIISDVIANQMDADCIVLDSVYNVLVDGYSGVNNNRQGTGAREIVVRQTGAQQAEKIRLVNIQCLHTAAAPGTAGPAIEVDAAVDVGRVDIASFDIKQPSGGGGYSLPEVKVPIAGDYPTQSMSGRGQLGRYAAIGSVVVPSGAPGVSITLATPYPMAYRPTPAQISLAMEGVTLPAHRIQYTSDNQIYVTFSSALGASGTIHWRVVLTR